jgi:hypothetical protein
VQNGNVIEVVLQLVDQATAPLKQATSQINTQLDGIKSKFGSIGTLIGVALGGWSLAKLIQNVAEADTVAAKLDNAFQNLGKNAGVTRQQLDDMAASVQRSTTFSDEAVKMAQTRLLTFTKIQGDTFERTIRASADMAAAMGTDVSSAARMLGRALQDPQMGMMLLRRQGVSLSAQQREMIQDMVKLGDTAGAQNKILELLEGRYRGAAEAIRNTLSGAIQGLQNSLGDLIEGDRDSFKGAVQAINELARTLESPEIKAGFDIMISAVMKLIEWLARLGVEFGHVLNGARMVGEAFAKFTTGTRSTEMLDVLGGKLQRLQNERTAFFVGGRASLFSRSLKEIDAEIAAVRQQIGFAREEYAATVRATAGTAGKMQPPRVELPKIDVEATAGAFKKIQEALRSEVEKTTEAVRQQKTVIDKLYALSDEDLALEGLTRADLDKARAGLDAMLAAVVKKAAETGKKVDAALRAGLSEVEVTAREVGGGAMDALFEEMDTSTQTGFERQLAQWYEFMAKIEELQKAGLDPQTAANRMFEARSMVAPLQALARVQEAVLQPQLVLTTQEVQRLGAEIAKLYEPSDQTLLQLGTSREELDAALVGLNELSDRARTATSDIKEFALQAFRSIQATMADFLFDPFAEGLDGMLKGFVDTIRRMVAELAAQKLLTMFFSSMANAGGGVGSFFGDLLKMVGGSAGGGMIPAGKPRWVGEDGPELIVPTAQSDVFNAREMLFNRPSGGAALPAMAFHYTIDARGADSARIMAVLPGMLQRTKQETIAAVVDLQRRGRLS